MFLPWRQKSALSLDEQIQACQEQLQADQEQLDALM